jgi:hypothetical protein
MLNLALSIINLIKVLVIRLKIKSKFSLFNISKLKLIIAFYCFKLID